ncbi:MAG: hypothetical protein QXE05_06540 [Nitrososphaeria archaeon]
MTIYMVKTTIVLEDDLYKELVREALEKYGTTRKLSKLINEKLRKAMYSKIEIEEKSLRIKLGRKLGPDEIEKIVEEGWSEVLGWKL